MVWNSRRFSQGVEQEKGKCKAVAVLKSKSGIDNHEMCKISRTASLFVTEEIEICDSAKGACQ